LWASGKLFDLLRVSVNIDTAIAGVKNIQVAIRPKSGFHWLGKMPRAGSELADYLDYLIIAVENNHPVVAGVCNGDAAIGRSVYPVWVSQLVKWPFVDFAFFAKRFIENHDPMIAVVGKVDITLP
jgi:hypothetical protein